MNQIFGIAAIVVLCVTAGLVARGLEKALKAGERWLTEKVG